MTSLAATHGCHVHRRDRGGTHLEPGLQQDLDRRATRVLGPSEERQSRCAADLEAEGVDGREVEVQATLERIAVAGRSGVHTMP